MSRPVLGVVCCTRTIGGEQAQAVINRYVEAAIAHAGAAALLVPSLPGLMAAHEVAPRIDGLLLTGSPSNVAPELYGQDGAADAEGPFDPDRDTMTNALVSACLSLGRPVFGICRGLQELNVAFGGTLRRDMSRDGAPLPHHAPADADREGLFGHGHEVDLAAGGMLRSAIGRDRIWVNSVHYQGIDRLGAGLATEATAPDGAIEAVSGRVNDVPVLAVQWHPEWRTDADPHSRTFFSLLGRALRRELAETH